MALDTFFTQIHIPIDCEVLVAQRCFGTDEEWVEFKITEVYHLHPTRALQMHRVGSWSSGNGLTWTNIPFYYRRRDLQGIVLKGAFIPDVSNIDNVSLFPCMLCQHYVLLLKFLSNLDGISNLVSGKISALLYLNSTIYSQNHNPISPRTPKISRNTTSLMT